MSKTILANNNLVEITFTKDNTWQTVDLTSLLNHDDPKAVIIHVVNTQVSGPPPYGWNTGVRPTGSAISDLYTSVLLINEGQRQAPVALNGSNEIDLLCAFGGAAVVKFYIHAEIGGDNFVAHSDWSAHSTGVNNQWVTRDNTTLYGADAGQVVADLLYAVWDNGGDWGYRSFGSIDNWHPNNQIYASGFGIVGVDSQDRFQTWSSTSSTKTPQLQVWWFSAGYFLKDWKHVVDPADRGLATTGAWTDDDITSETDPAAEIALIRFGNTNTPTNDGWLREDGGSEIVRGFNISKFIHLLVNLDSTQVYEYWIDSIDQDAYVVGYFAPSLGKFIIDTHKLIIDSGRIIIG